MIYHYIKVAWRNLIKSKGQTLISIIGLAVGVFCFSLCSYLVRYWINEDESVSRKERIAEMVLATEARTYAGTPSNLAPELESKQLKEIERITVATYNLDQSLSFEISDNKTLPYEMHVIETDTNFLSVFDVALLSGDIRTINKKPNMLLLSQSASRKIYGEENPIGKKVTGEDQNIYTIGGVFEDMPVNSSLGSSRPIEILTLSVLNGELVKRIEGITGCKTYVLLSSGFNASDLDKRLLDIDYKMLITEKDPLPVRSFPLGHSKYSNNGLKMFYVFIFFIGLLILLSSLLNYFSFFTNRFFNRIKEFSIRKGVGENKKQLFSLLFTELFLSMMFSGIFALCLVDLFVPGFQFKYYRIQVKFDTVLLAWQIIEYIVICLGVAAVICGMVCNRLNRYSLMEGMRFSRHRVRNLLLGIQFFITLLFFTGAIVATFQTKEGEDRLFSSLTKADKERIFFVRTDSHYLGTNHDVLLSKWRGNSLVEDVMQVHDKLTNTRINSYNWGEKDGYTAGGVLYASGNAPEFLHLKALSGTLNLDEQSILINETFMQAIKENPINKFIRINNESNGYKVNGVTSSILRFMDGSEYFASMAIVFLQEKGNCYVRITEGKEKEGKAFLSNTIKEFLPESIQPEIYSLKEECDQVQLTERLLRNIFLFFAVVSLIINLLGIYAAISQDTEQRQKEVAIRKINGASIGVILKLFSLLYVRLLLITTLFVFPLMWLATDSVLKSWVIRFNYNNPFFWLGIFLSLALIIAFTIIFRILKTARMNPADIMKME